MTRDPNYRVHISESYSELILLNHDFDLLTLPDLELLIERMSSLARRAKSLSVDDPLRMLLLDSIRMTESNWVFKPTREDIKNAGECVYFLFVPHQQPFFKIGRTVNLWQRLNEHRRALSRDLRLMAFARSDDHKQLEKALHHAFSRYRFGTEEWFQADPVWDFLYSVERDWLK